MTARPRSLLAAAAVAVTAGLAGCSGGSTPEPEASTPGPLEAFFSDMYGNGDQESANAQMMRVEEIVAQCMSEQGFEYTPVDYSTQPGYDAAAEGPEEEWGTLEFAKKWGYGVTTNPWGGGEAVEEPMPSEEWVDPNQDYLNAMSETEQQAYYAALYGNQENVEGEEVEYDWTTAGCQGKAQHDVYEAGQDTDDVAALQEELGSMYEQVQSDDRITAVAAEWASCMADAGYPGFATIDDASNSIYERVNGLWEDAYSELDPETATEEDYAAIEDQVQEAQAAITEDEIATAVADITCQEDVDYQKVMRDVQREHEQEFYDAHADELEAWKAAYQDAQS
jgi:hypothetical protein